MSIGLENHSSNSINWRSNIFRWILNKGTRNKILVPYNLDRAWFLRQVKKYSDLLRSKTSKSLKLKSIKFKNFIAKNIDARPELKNSNTIISRAIRSALRLTLGLCQQVLKPNKQKALRAIKIKKNRNSKLRFNSPAIKTRTPQSKPINDTETSSQETLSSDDNLLEQAQALAELAKDTLMKNLEKYDDESKAELLINLVAISENWDNLKSCSSPFIPNNFRRPLFGQDEYLRPRLEAMSRPKGSSVLIT